MVKWNAIYKRISLMENPELGSGSVLNQWEKEGRKLSKWELCRVVKELRKFKRYKHALEVKRKQKWQIGFLFNVCGLLCLMGISYFLAAKPSSHLPPPPPPPPQKKKERWYFVVFDSLGAFWLSGLCYFWIEIG
jgi:hypothetical protein